MKVAILVLVALFLSCGSTRAEELQVTMHLLTAEGIGDAIGTVTISETEAGLVLTPQLEHLSAGQHGFHVHRNPSCLPMVKDGQTVPGLSASGHYDPTGAGSHGSPTGKGHLGDLPALTVDENGRATTPVLAPRLNNLKEVRGRALIIHAGGDNYSDTPNKLGGGGARVACGVIE